MAYARHARLPRRRRRYRFMPRALRARCAYILRTARCIFCLDGRWNLAPSARASPFAIKWAGAAAAPAALLCLADHRLLYTCLCHTLHFTLTPALLPLTLPPALIFLPPLPLARASPTTHPFLLGVALSSTTHAYTLPCCMHLALPQGLGMGGQGGRICA